jgi:hypothetical protein
MRGEEVVGQTSAGGAVGCSDDNTSRQCNVVYHDINCLLL